MSPDSAVQALNAIATLLVLAGIGGAIFFRNRAATPSIEKATIGVVVSASAGLIAGGAFGSMLWHTTPTSPRLLRRSAVVTLIGGIALTRTIAVLARIACDGLTRREGANGGLGDFCGWNGAAIGLLTIDALLLALLLTLAANRAQIAAEQ